MAYAMEEETTMMIPPQGMEEDMGEGIASLPEQGDSGIADLPQAAQQLAQLGRAQDTFLGHLSQDEVVIPRELLQASPELEDMIRNAFESEGMDYTQYVVGSEENSINPETGLPEFFVKTLVRKAKKAVKGAGKSLKKAAKKVEKAVRKPVKKIARELKKAAPVVLPIALTYFAGPQASFLKKMLLSSAGSGIGTLIAGGDTKDALRNAAIAAAVTGAVQGAQNYAKTGSILDSGSVASPEFAGEPVKYVGDGSPPPPTKFPPPGGYDSTKIVAENITPPPPEPTGIIGAAKQKTIDAYNATKDAMKKVGDYAFRGGRSEEQILLDKARASVNVPKFIDGEAIDAATRATLQKEAVAQAAPGALAKYGPTAALVYGAGKVFGGGGGEEEGDDSAMEEFNREQAEKEAIAAQIANLPIGDINYITSQQTLAGAPNYQYLP
jgi:hypothetical protein